MAANEDTEVLIVEMAMRKAGDLTFLTKMVQPDVVVFTGVGKTHIEFFDSQKSLAKAKMEVFRKSQKWQHEGRVAFLNNNGAYAPMVQKAASMGYQTISYEAEDKVGENINACYAVGAYFDVSQLAIQNALQTYKGSAQRLALINHNGIRILDDTYNANPTGMLYALQYLRRFQGRKIAVLGDMLELGTHSKEEHSKIEQWALDNEVDLLFLYGPAMKKVSVSGISMVHFDEIVALCDQLVIELKQGDVVLVKGSRGLKMERIVTFCVMTYLSLAFVFLGSIGCQYGLILFFRRRALFQQIYELSPESHQKKAATPSLGVLGCW